MLTNSAQTYMKASNHSHSDRQLQHSSRTAKFANVVNMGCLAWLTKIDPVVDLPIRMAQCFQ